MTKDWDNPRPASTRAASKTAPLPTGSFVEETCNCGRVWRGKPGSKPASGCPDCGEAYEAERQWRRENHHP